MRPIRLSGQMSVIDITDSEPDEEVLLLPSGTKTTAGSSSTRTNDFSQYLAQVLEIVPDVDPEHALALLKSHHESRGSNAVEPVLHALFEDNSYPKVNKDKGKRKREEDEANERAKSRKIDYGDKNRAPPKGPNYRTLAIVCLCILIWYRIDVISTATTVSGLSIYPCNSSSSATGLTQ